MRHSNSYTAIKVEDDKHIPHSSDSDTFCRNLLYLSYFIAVSDFHQALYLLIQSTTLLILDPNLYSVIAFIGSVSWNLIVFLLLVGLWQSCYHFLLAWLVLSMINIIADMLFLIWTIAIATYMDWSQIIKFTLLYLGIVIEWVCVYVVYNYCFKLREDNLHLISAIEELEVNLKETRELIATSNKELMQQLPETRSRKARKKLYMKKKLEAAQLSEDKKDAGD